MDLLGQLKLSDVGLIIGIVGLALLLVLTGVFFAYFRLWIQAKLTRAGIGIANLLGMSFRKVSPKVIVQSKVTGRFENFVVPSVTGILDLNQIKHLLPEALLGQGTTRRRRGDRFQPELFCQFD